ncbi:hypothetical protein [Methanococcus maripaludis]|uniref:Uncharacterized protein n=1 Tax=Methanococcus maripaludis TaxID=39152 RepID=A0A2L1CAM4_METMI|nr:hypothetical protein [Methanococcus maripaludis]AVB75926.1 hypothetical protein MMJJ_05090 [Methanococcus maripaludis]MBB6497865.1 hypothetical protein [Methanococcus maripaludis]
MGEMLTINSETFEHSNYLDDSFEKHYKNQEEDEILNIQSNTLIFQRSFEKDEELNPEIVHNDKKRVMNYIRNYRLLYSLDILPDYVNDDIYETILQSMELRKSKNKQRNVKSVLTEILLKGTVALMEDIEEKLDAKKGE